MAKLMTATEFANLETDDDRPRELIAGRVVVLPIPYAFYGLVCANVSRRLSNHVGANDSGRVMARSGVITNSDPDTVRLADVSYYSFERLPRGRFPEDRFLDVRPELAVEVPLPGERWTRVLVKVAEFLNAGVEAVCVVDTANGTVCVYRDDRSPEPFAADAELTLPDVLPGFRVPVRQFFE
jgi:Uma2 family endonuclease